MKSQKQQKFESDRQHLTEREVMMELLYATYLNYRSTEAVRTNTSTLVWFVIIGVVLSIGLGVLSAIA